MNKKLKNQLVGIARKRLAADDPSHDFTHTERVLKNALNIAQKEGGDLEIIIPGALFHDLVIYAKNDPRNKHAVDESAKEAEKILKNMATYPPEKIGKVKRAILATSPHGLEPTCLEAEIIRDADLLEATGVIAIMRTFASTGKMNRPFYNPSDPFAKKRELDNLAYAIDLFYTLLLKVEEKVTTQPAKQIAARRSKFLKLFLNELEKELQGA